MTTGLEQSALSRMIARMQTQRAMLDAAFDRLQGQSGVILEIGLGKARTFDHLKHLAGNRPVIAFDFEVHAPAWLVSPGDRIETGDFKESLVRVRSELQGQAILAHADTGSRDPIRDANQSAWLGSLIEPLMAPGGIVLSDRPLTMERASVLEFGVDFDWPYHAWQMPR